MKNLIKIATPSLFVSVICLICPAQANAQAEPTQVGLARLARTKVDKIADKNGGAEQAASALQTPRVAFPRKWNEDRALLRLAVENAETTELKIEGVQTSSSLYVVSFPAIISAGARGELVLRYAARPGVNGDADLVRLLTNQGEKAIEVRQEREQVFTLAAPSLEWKVGEPVVPKTVGLSILQAGIRPKAVRVFGEAKPAAEIIESGAGQYLVQITPASTAKPMRFAVMVEFDPALPGTAPVIQCVVAPVN